MKKYAKRLLIAFLASAMVVAIVPSTVLADIVANLLRISANNAVIPIPTVKVTDITEKWEKVTITRGDLAGKYNYAVYTIREKGEEAASEAEAAQEQTEPLRSAA